MRLLVCSPVPLSKELGAAKPLLELVEELQELGWTCDLLGPSDIRPDLTRHDAIQGCYADCLRAYLQTHAGKYDVVDYDHNYLPYPRTEFDPRTLFVARSVLLTHHLETERIPGPKGLRGKIGRCLRQPSRRAQLRRWLTNATATVREADLVNVSNNDDKEELVRRGIAADKIIVIPFGICQARRPLFEAISPEPPEQPVVAFVGTFDYRKGAADFPTIVRRVAEAVPHVRFRLLGTRGLYQTARDVLAHFPARLTGSIHVVPDFRPEELPGLLADCSVGVFPSYLEGFGFGVLEMLAAAVPVIAYAAPGATMMLPPEYLVERGDVLTMSSKVTCLLRDREKLRGARVWARQQSQPFSWRRIARITSESYSRFVSKRR